MHQRRRVPDRCRCPNSLSATASSVDFEEPSTQISCRQTCRGHDFTHRPSRQKPHLSRSGPHGVTFVSHRFELTRQRS